MRWYHIYAREMLLLYKKIGKLGYIFSSIMMPLLYLSAFGLGLGGRGITGVGESYIDFLSKGMIGMTVMLNSFQQTSLSVSINRFYFGSFQTIILSPVSSLQAVVGIALAGVVRGVIMGGIVYLASWIFFGVTSISPIGMLAIFIAAFCFAALGLIIGLVVDNPDALSLVNNFLLMPMTLFCGSFFPVSNLPHWLGIIVSKLPLSLVNGLVRAQNLHAGAWQDIIFLTMIGIIALCIGVIMFERYSE